MADIIDLKVKVGNSSSNMSSLPCAIDTPTPIISWELPSNIKQQRFNIRIRPVNNAGLFINGSLLSSQTTFQYPSTSRMNYKYYGLCCLEIAISENKSGEYEYSSGELYFVYDDILEILRTGEKFVFRWDNASDNETLWSDMKYNLVVSYSPLFEDKNIIFDGIVNSTSKNETSYSVLFDKKYNFVYWKVRAFDGLDYGDFTQVNAFKMTDNNPPVIKINSIIPYNDTNKDVEIDITVIDSENDRINLEVYYCGGSVGDKYVLASLINSVVCIKPGSYRLIWRSSLDERKISSSDYKIKIVAIDDGGLYSFDESDNFYMDNLSVGADIGTNSSISNIYTVIGKIALVNRFTYEKDECPLSSKMIIFGDSYTYEFPNISGKIETFNTYRTGGLIFPLTTPPETEDNNGGDWVFSGGGGDDEETVEPEYPKGMLIYQGESQPEKGDDLDSDDPDFVRDIEHVDEDGNFREMSERIGYKNINDIIRSGYARFLYSFYACEESKCETCNGKGWLGVEEDKTVPSTHKYKYKRKVCQDCLGNRFIEEPNISPSLVKMSKSFVSVNRNEKLYLNGGRRIVVDDDFLVTDSDGIVDTDDYTIDANDNSIIFARGLKDVTIIYNVEKYKVETKLFTVSRWIPIERYFSPYDKVNLIHSFKLCGNIAINSMKKFKFSPTLSSGWFSEYERENSNSRYRFKVGSIPDNSYYQIDCPLLKNKMLHMHGVYNGINTFGRLGVKKEQKPIKSNYRLMGNAHVDKLDIREHISRLSGRLTNIIKEYIPGTTYDNPIFASGRKTPTHRYEPGLFGIRGSLYRENELGNLKIIFLQSSWQVYNTIHWSGAGSASTLTQLQYCKINNDGSNGVFYDIISENSDYYEEQGIWFVHPQTWHCYWNTEEQITRDNDSSYRIRIRQYNILSKTFTQWSYSESSFTFKDNATNPANIYYTEYFKFSKKLYIYYRLDDKDMEPFNIVSVSYRVDGGRWIVINKSNLSGDMAILSSNPGADGNGNKHLIVWDTSSFNLKASNDYRIKIEVVKTKFVSGYSIPVLKWHKTPNTTSDMQERLIETYDGSWVKFYWDENDKKAKSLENPVYVKGRIKEVEDEIFKLKCQNNPLPSTCNGYFTFVTGVDIVKDGDDIISANVTNSRVVNSVIVDGKEYFLKDWLNYKINGVSRNTLLYNYSSDINSYIEIVNSAKDIIEDAKRYTRRCLIDQGYYCNGFKNNIPVYVNDYDNSNSYSTIIDESCYFKFKVITYFDDSFDNNGFYKPKFSEYAGDIIDSGTISDTLSDGTITTSQYTYHEYERTSHVLTRILIDKYSTFNSQNGKPLRDIIFDEYGDRIATNVGGDNYIENDARENNSSHDSYLKEPEYEMYSIPMSMLPGERYGDITEYDTFEGDYNWKVSSYNLLYGRPEEKPEFYASSTYVRNIIRLNIITRAPEGLTTARINNIKYIDKLFDKYLIERDCSNSQSAYFDEYNYLYGNEIIKETVFVTDPPDYAINKGYCAEFTWTPLTKYRTRPIVIIDDDDEKHFWYIKEDNYGSKIICHAKGKTFFRVGEYDTAIPYSNKLLSEELSGIVDVFSHSIVKLGKTYMMYYIANNGSEYDVRVSTSRDGNVWNHGSVSVPRDGIYNISVSSNGNMLKMLYCVRENGVFNIYSSLSDDGNLFSNEELVMSSNNAISSVFSIDDIIFYTEEVQLNDNSYKYTIKCSSDIFPSIENASNPYVIKDCLGYRIFFDRDGKIYSAFMKNYIEKSIVKNDNYLSSVVSGNMDMVYSSVDGVSTMFSINRMYQSGFDFYCTDEFREMNLDDIIGWVIYGENNAKYKEYRIEGKFLTNENKDSVEGAMEPYPFRYMYIIKDLY